MRPTYEPDFNASAKKQINSTLTEIATIIKKHLLKESIYKLNTELQCTPW